MPKRQINLNFKYLVKSYVEQQYKDDVLINGKRGVILEGGSRSGKSWSGVDFIIFLCTRIEKNCTIHIYREFFADFAGSLYDDFKRRLDDFGIDNPFHNAQIVKSFKIFRNTISFKGCDKVGSKHGSGADYVFYNEMMHIPQNIFDQSEMRCRKFWWGDYNPSFTEHWIFDKILTRPDIGYLHNTLLDNPFITTQEKNKILGFEPWETGIYTIEDNTVMYNGKPVDEKNQPPPNKENIENGTADSFMWRVYGLGLRGAMEGQIFKRIIYIKDFPDLAHTYGLDFGFTNDKTALVKFAQDSRNIYMELLIYKPISDPDELSASLEAVGVSKYVPITADSSDRYVSEKKGVVLMVRDLFDRGWEISKVSKTKSIMYWIASMQTKKIHIISSDLVRFFKTEQDNYRFKEVNGILINQPIDGWDHAFSSGRYAHMSHDVNTMEVESY